MNRRAFLKLVGAVTVVAPLASKLDWLLPEALVPAEEATAPVVNGVVPPVGTIYPWVGAIPDGWLLCDGQAVSPARYPALAKVIRDTFGREGMRIRVPDMRVKTVGLVEHHADRAPTHLGPVSVSYVIRGA